MTIRYFEIRTPKRDFTGRIGPISFADGVARVQFDDTRGEPTVDKKTGKSVPGVAEADLHQVSPGRSLVMFAKRRPGYEVTELDENGKPLPVGDEGEAKPAGAPSRAASKADWKAYAIGNGFSEADAETATRDQLAERFLGPKEA